MRGLLNLKKFHNPLFIFVASRYGTYGLQFVNSLLIATTLGPYYLGLWGVINLVAQYLSYSDLGISQSSSVLISIHKNNDEKKINSVVSNSILLITAVNVLLGLLYLFDAYFINYTDSKYNIEEYKIWILVIAVFTNYNALFSNIFRIYAKLNVLSFAQSLLAVSYFASLLFFREGELLKVLVYTFTIVTFLITVCYLWFFPLRFNFTPSKIVINEIRKKAGYLFLYNSAFNFITITTKSYVSYFYSVRDFGLFTFSFTLANVFIMLFDSFTFLVWPKLINRLHNKDNEEARSLLNLVREKYIVVSYSIVFLGIFLMPYFLVLFPEYGESYYPFVNIVLTLLLYVNAFGYQGLLLAKGKEVQIAVLAFISLIINGLIAFLLIKYFQVGYQYVIIATSVSYFIYVTLLNLMGRSLLNIKGNLLFDSFPPRSFTPLVIAFVMVALEVDKKMFFIPLLLFLGLNFSTIKNTVVFAVKNYKNKDLFEI